MANVNMPSRPPTDDALTTILKGLQIAQGVYGIQTDMAKLDDYQKTQAAAKAKEERLRSGTFYPSEALDYGKTNDITYNPDGTTPGPNQVNGNITGPDGALTPMRMTIRQAPVKPAPLVPVDVYDPKSKTTSQQFVTPTEGATYLQPPKATPNVSAQGLTPYQEINLGNQADAKKEKAIQNLGADQIPFQKLFLSLDNIQKTIAAGPNDPNAQPYTKFGKDFKIENYDNSPVNLPGTNVPGVGRVSFYSPEARSLNSQIATVFNAELKDRSGAAVTNSELERLKTEFANGKFDTEEGLLKALKDYKVAATNLLQSTEAKYDPKIIKAYQQRGGFTSADLVDPTTELKTKAKTGDKKAQQYLKSQGIDWSK